ncbi:hypothetical protein B5M09_002918 [Aphanomyces astaci]|uniref:EF-hand domain-containing protein n=2 Tax=Aphanomyces astaci TaxID=112090 RepID=A0A425DB43_APHAT|nr:hypothetical protein B5M09_002918 [Aphanomyces astaci]
MGGKFSQVHYRERDTAVVSDFDLLVQCWYVYPTKLRPAFITEHIHRGKVELETISTQLRRISFNFCLTREHFQEMLQLHHNDLFRPVAHRWFHHFKNTDTSTIVNGLEFVAALAIASTGTGKLVEKVGFLFDLFDFDQSGCLTKDELMILLKSSVRGLTKLTQGLGLQLAKLCPMAQIEDLAAVCFRHCGLDPSDDLRRDAFIHWVQCTPKLTNLLKCYVSKDKLTRDEAAVSIQRVARGMLGRNFVDELRLHKQLLQNQELDVAATKIQEAMLNRKKRQETIRRSKVERNASSGAMYSFGANTHGLLGHEFHELDKPVKDPKLNAFFKHADLRVVSVASSLVHAAAVTSSGVAYTWGACAPGAFGTVFSKGGAAGGGSPPDVVRPCPQRVDDLSTVQVTAVALGARHSMALTSDGVVYSWGSGEFGQLGHGDIVNNELFQQQFDPHTSRSYPMIDLPLRLDKSLFDEIQIKQIACGYYFSVALAEDGCVYTWGEGSDGQLGLGLSDDFHVGFLDEFIHQSNFTYMPTPQYIHLDEPMGHVAVGGNHVFAVSRSHRTVLEWGAAFRRDGDPIYLPTPNAALSALYVKSISVGKDFALAITGCVYLKLSGCECMYGLTAAFGTQPVDLYVGLSAPLIAAGVPKAKLAYAVKEEWSQKVVFIDRGKPTGSWLTVQSDSDQPTEPLTLACVASSFGPVFENGTLYTGQCFYTPQKLSSLKYYVRPEEIQGKVVVLHVEESDLPVHHPDDDVAIVVERLMVMMVDKVKDAQACGALGVVTVFSFMADAFSLGTGDDDKFAFGIPSVMLSAAAGARLLAYIQDHNHANIHMQLYHHDDTLGEQLLAIQQAGAVAVVLDESVFAGLGNAAAHAKQVRIPVLTVSHETGTLIKSMYQRLIQDTFAEIGIANFGDVYAWGAGSHGGDVDDECKFSVGYDAVTNTTYPLAKTPQVVDALVQTRIMTLSCGDQHSAAVSGLSS